MTSKELDKIGHPPCIQRLFWALILALVGIIVLAIGGLDAVQLSSVIIGVSTIFVFVLMTICFIKWANKDFRTESKATLVRNSSADHSEEKRTKFERRE